MIKKKLITKKFISLACMMTLAVSLVGCGSKDGAGKNEASIDQLAGPQQGDTIATFNIKDYGSVKVRLFKDGAPKAVENFETHTKEGYYDGVTFHRVINDFMIQGGDPQGNGTGGESIWGTEFEDEINKDLLPLRGALCMANAGGGNTNGSQFFIVQSQAKDSEDKEEVKNMLSQYIAMYKEQTGLKLESYSDLAAENFTKQGGCLFLSGGYTVFGQAFEGLDVVDKIAATETDGSDKPLEDVIIESIEITEFEG